MYVEQHPHFNLGNFIACTPTIRYMFELTGRKVPVLFHTEYVKQCYVDSPFIEIIDSPGDRKRAFGSDLICRKNTIEDYLFIQQLIIGSIKNKQPFIDQPEPLLSHKYGVFINGSGSEVESYLDRKLIPFEIQQIIKDNSTIPVVGVGSLEDQKRNIFDGDYGDIRKALSIINGAQWVISNVTGFYHAAGAMNKKQLVLRKNCLFPRCKNINPDSITANSEDWGDAIIKFLS